MVGRLGSPLWYLSVLAILASVEENAPALEPPAVEAPVNDYADLLDSQAEARITDRIVEHRASTGVQIAVVTVEDVGNVPIEDYALEVVETWKGGSRGRDFGILYLIARDNGQMRLELGYGIEPYLSDGEARRILESATGAFSTGDYSQGIRQVIEKVIDHTSRIEPEVEPDGPKGTEFPFVYLVVVLLGLVFGVILNRSLRLDWGRTARVRSEPSPIRSRPVQVVVSSAACLLVPLIIGLLFRQSDGSWWAHVLVYFIALAAVFGFLTFLSKRRL